MNRRNFDNQEDYDAYVDYMEGMRSERDDAILEGRLMRKYVGCEL